LKLLGSSDVDHLDTASAYYTATYTLERAFTRQLFSYPASTDITTSNTPVADLATVLPTTANGGISADGKTYTIHLRTDAQWNTTPARPVTAQDEVLGLKRLCNPVSPAGAPGYYENTIAGMKAFCDGFAKVSGTAPAIAAYIDGHDISGVTATDATTLTIKLLQPANDFLNILAMPFLPFPGDLDGRVGGAMTSVPLEAAPPIVVEVRTIEGRSPLRLAFARLRRDRVSIVSAAAILVLVVVALAAPLVAHLVGHDPTTQYRDTGLTPAGLPVGSNRHFLFGTDNLGRDVFIRVVYGTRISLLVGVLSTVIAVALGVVIGVTAGYFQAPPTPSSPGSWTSCCPSRSCCSRSRWSP
jgi:extracellular solute-binding protein (family 5)/oligopeptide transport permease C-like protein